MSVVKWLRSVPANMAGKNIFGGGGGSPPSWILLVFAGMSTDVLLTPSAATVATKSNGHCPRTQASFNVLLIKLETYFLEQRCPKHCRSNNLKTRRQWQGSKHTT